MGPLSHGGGSSEVGEELEAEAHHKVPDVSGHLGPGDEDSPEDHSQDCVEGVANVPQPRTHTWDTLDISCPAKPVKCKTTIYNNISIDFFPPV